MTFQPSPQQAAYFSWLQEGGANDHAIVEAVAGAGKTTTLVKGLDFMQGRVFLGAYNAKMGRELAERVKGRQGVYAKTFHAAGKGALEFAFKRRYDSADGSLDGSKVYKMIQKWIDADATNRAQITPIATCIADIVSMAKQRGFGPLVDHENQQNWLDMVTRFDLDGALPEGQEKRINEAVALAYEFLGASTDNLDVIDFDDMVYLPLAYDLRMLRHDFVLVDEAQDTNPTRRALAWKMLERGGRMVAVGDPRQAIFGFTGADNDALAQIGSEMVDRGQLATLPLTVTYRCPKAVVAHARRWVSHITAHETAPAGRVSEIDAKELVGVVQPGEAILCRYNKPLAQLYFRLIRAGVRAKIEGKDIGQRLIKLANRWKVKTLDALDTKLDNYLAAQKAKADAKSKPELYANALDEVETLRVLMERARQIGGKDVATLKTVADEMFANDVSGSFVILSSAHKSKGLEWDTVYLLGREEFMPASFAKQAWQIEQEMNLIYVAVTRAKKHLIEVRNVKAALEAAQVKEGAPA